MADIKLLDGLIEPNGSPGDYDSFDKPLR